MRVALYVRVSTDEQTTENQLRELRAVGVRAGWEIVAKYVDHGISGAKGRNGRPEFDRLQKDAARRQFDLVACCSVDRLGRSLQDLVAFLNEIHASKVGLYLHQQGIDTTTPSGRALFQMCGVFAEFERAMIQERVRAGLARAKEHGTKSGRPIGRPRVEVATEMAIRKLRRKGYGVLKIAREAGVGVSVVQRVLTA
ncbi:MAG: recombinase family protein [Burkholderiales bacterium]